MAVDEALTLDGLALHSGGLTLEGFDAPPPKKRLEWVEGGDADGAALVRDPLFENRVVTVRVRVDRTATMDLALAKITAVTDKLEEAEKQEGGLPLVWTPADSTKTGTFYVLSGEVEDMPVTQSGDGAGWFQRSPVLVLKLTCKPFIYGSEVVGSPTSSTAPLVEVTVADVPGDVPAEARLIVTDNATQNRRFCEWGLESRFYNAATSLILDSDSMVTSGFSGVQATRTGAYDPNGTGNNVIGATVYAEPTQVCGTGNLSHVGTFRVRARVYSTSDEVRCRLAWQSGDGPFSYNPYAAPPAVDAFSEVDLGLIHVPEKDLGTQRWSGKVEAYGPAAGATFQVDTLYFVPAGEGYGKARAAAQTTGKGNLQAFDQFNSISAGTVLNARVSPLGGSWATSGATTDFAAADAPDSRETMSRATISDAAGGRVAALGATNFTDMRVECAIRATAWTTVSCTMGVIARYVDASNYLVATMQAQNQRLQVVKRVAGVDTTLINRAGVALADNTWYALVVTCYATGTVVAEVQSGAGATIISVGTQDSALATGGTLASGKPGIRDVNTSAGAVTRYYEDFYTHVPPPEPIVCYSSQSIEFRSDQPLREDSTGTYWGPPPSYRGSPFYLREGGDEARTNRIAVRLRRNDVDVAADANIADSTTVQVNRTPRYIAVPG